MDTTNTGSDTPMIALEGERIGKTVGFNLSSDRTTGTLLRCLAAIKPGGRLLEVGSGLAVGAAWLLEGMDDDSELVTIEIHPEAASVCRDLLAEDTRATVVEAEAAGWLEAYNGPPFDLAFVDTTIVKFERLDLLLDVLAPGAILIADDLLPQPKWLHGHIERVARFRANIVAHPRLHAILIDWGTGILLASKKI